MKKAIGGYVITLATMMATAITIPSYAQFGDKETTNLITTETTQTTTVAVEETTVQQKPEKKKIKKKKKVYKFKTKYVTTSVNGRKKNSIKSKVLKVFSRRTKVKAAKYSKKWSIVKYKKKIYFIRSKYLSKKRPKKLNYRYYSVPSGHHPKCYMDWRCITSVSSPQYKLMQKSHIGKYGVIQYKNRYCVALGSYYYKRIGTKFDLILRNGTVIKCIAGDQKADCDTDGLHRQTADGSVAEFIVSTASLSSTSRRMGSLSYACKAWNSEIKTIRVYH